MQVPSGSLMTIPHPEVRGVPRVGVSCLNPAPSKPQGGLFQLHLCSSGAPINVMALNHEQKTAQELSRTNQSQAPGPGGVAEWGGVLTSTEAESGDLSMDIVAMIESATTAKLMKSVGEFTGGKG